MFGPLALIAKDPIIMIVLVLAFLAGLVLHNFTQARLAARLGDATPAEAGFATLEPQAHVTLFTLVAYLLLGLGVPRTVPTRLTGSRAAAALLAGPAALMAWAVLLLTVRQLLQTALPEVDVVNQGLRAAAAACVLHALFFLLPYPLLDGGRALWEVSPRRVQRVLAAVAVAGPVGLYILWLGLLLSGATTRVLAPVWSGLQSLLSWLPF